MCSGGTANLARRGDKLPILKMDCRALLVDLDGTLIDSAPHILRVWARWARRNGIPKETVLNAIHGRRGLDTIRLVAPWLPAESEQAALETEEISEMSDVRPYPGAVELMEKLQNRPLAIVTSGSRRVAEARLGHVGMAMPKVLICGDEINAGKPAPDGYILAARRLGMEPADCAVIEDSPVGVEAAKAAGMRVIAVTSTHRADELERADAVVSHLTKIGLGLDGTTIELVLGQEAIATRRQKRTAGPLDSLLTRDPLF